MNKPNILFIITDDQRRDTIHSLGNTDIITPNLDSLVKEGTSFTNTYIAGGYTGAICMPSRAMINTGKYLTSLVNNGADISNENTILGEYFKTNNYYTFGCGKWHNGPKAFTRSFCSGKNAFFSGMWDHWNVPVCDYDPLGNYDNVINFVTSFTNNKKIRKVHCDKFNPGVHSSSLVADTTVEFLQNYDKEEPFFCYTAFLAPHDPRTMPPEFSTLYKDKKLKLPENLSSNYPVNYANDNMRDELLTPYPRAIEETESEIKDYYAMITHLDFEIGKILTALKTRKDYDNTIIVFCSDNGLGLGSHGFMGKQNLYEESISIPLIIKGPNIAKNERNDSRIFLHDLFPTLCDLVNIPIPSAVEGNSFYNLLKKETFQQRDEMYLIALDRARAIIKEDYKLSLYYNVKTNVSDIVLYDIKHDPLEMHNLILKKPELTKKLLTILLQKRIEVNDIKSPEAQIFWNNIKIPKEYLNE